jgi:xylulokinase
MSLLGIDVGTTGCKASAFSEEGRLLASAYCEYDVDSPQPGWAQLDALAIWPEIESIIGQVAHATGGDPIQAISVSSLGEAVVPVSRDRRVLAPSILNFDIRGETNWPALGQVFNPEDFYRITGNTLGNHFGLPKIMWIRQHQPELYDAADWFLPWSSFVPFMLGAEPGVDFSLANRLLGFDLEHETWSTDILAASGVDEAKLPTPCPTGTILGRVESGIAGRLGFAPGVMLVAGGHDQCINAIGCGVLDDGQALCGMGTYICIAPVFSMRPPVDGMIERGLNTEHHGVPGKLVSFIYNQGGALLKWYRNTFAAELRPEPGGGSSVYEQLLGEMPNEVSRIMALPHFIATGPPEFITNSSGVLAGLHLNSSRGEILKGLLQGALFYLRECVEALDGTGIELSDFCAAGGGSRSDVWLQLTADIMGKPITRPVCTEAGALGAAIVAGSGVGRFSSIAEGARGLVRHQRTFEPDPRVRQQMESQYQHYRKIWPLMRDYLADLS